MSLTPLRFLHAKKFRRTSSCVKVFGCGFSFHTDNRSNYVNLFLSFLFVILYLFTNFAHSVWFIPKWYGKPAYADTRAWKLQSLVSTHSYATKVACSHIAENCKNLDHQPWWLWWHWRHDNCPGSYCTGIPNHKFRQERMPSTVSQSETLPYK